MIKVGQFNTLKVIRTATMGVFLDDGEKGILLPNRFLPANTKIDDELNVFIYHDGDERLIATTQTPFGIVGSIVKLKCVNTTPQGAFLDNGLMKDLFVPRNMQLQGMIKNGEYLVYIYIDTLTGRMAATEKFAHVLQNETLTVKALEEVNLTVLRRSNIGYVVIINNQHEGVLHHNEIYRPITVGDTFTGFIKHIYDDNRVDVAAGKPGYQRVENEAEKIIRLLQENNGYLPYYDKSDPEEIYSFFSMSKKTFKMTVGALYKQQKITLEKTGIKLL
jgi:uncharacterized protein